MDLRLSDHDLWLENGEVEFVRGIEAIAQHAIMRLRTWLGEADAYDTTAGVPYLQIIFTKAPNLTSVRFILERVILETPGVESVDLSLSLDTATRVLSVSGSLRALDQEIDFSEDIQA
jgi:hypothetical protein